MIIEKEYSKHIGISDKEFEAVGVEIKNSYSEVLNSCRVLIKVPTSDNEVNAIKANTILMGCLILQNIKKLMKLFQKSSAFS